MSCHSCETRSLEVDGSATELAARAEREDLPPSLPTLFCAPHHGGLSISRAPLSDSAARLAECASSVLPAAVLDSSGRLLLASPSADPGWLLQLRQQPSGRFCRWCTPIDSPQFAFPGLNSSWVTAPDLFLSSSSPSSSSHP